jgi:hypothetical protein
VWYDYDSHNNQIHSKDSNGDEAWYDYDSHNNQIHEKTSYGYEKWYEFKYDNEGRMIERKQKSETFKVY